MLLLQLQMQTERKRTTMEMNCWQQLLTAAGSSVLKAIFSGLFARANYVSCNIDVAEEKMQKKIVPLSLQLLMENAIKHNIVSSEKPLTIDVYALNGTLVVSNNLQKKNQVFESTGIGLDNIRNRYKLLSGKIVEVTESSTSFTVSIPLIEN